MLKSLLQGTNKFETTEKFHSREAVYSSLLWHQPGAKEVPGLMPD